MCYFFLLLGSILIQPPLFPSLLLQACLLDSRDIVSSSTSTIPITIISFLYPFSFGQRSSPPFLFSSSLGQRATCFCITFTFSFSSGGCCIFFPCFGCSLLLLCVFFLARASRPACEDKRTRHPTPTNQVTVAAPSSFLFYSHHQHEFFAFCSVMLINSSPLSSVLLLLLVLLLPLLLVFLLLPLLLELLLLLLLLLLLMLSNAISTISFSLLLRQASGFR